MTILTPRPAWHADPDRLLRRFVERLLLTSVVVDAQVSLRLEHNELLPLHGWPPAAYVLYDTRPVFPQPLWAARLRLNERNDSGISLAGLTFALREAGFDPLRAKFLRVPTLCHVHRWGDLPMLVEIEGLPKPVIITEEQS